MSSSSLISFSKGSASELGEALPAIQRFQALHRGKDIRVVSFHDTFPEDLDKGIGRLKWRELFSYEEMFELWEQAYLRLDSLLAELPETAKVLIETYYHDAAYIVWQGLAFQLAVKNPAAPTCYLVPDIFEERQDRFSEANWMFFSPVLSRLRFFVRSFLDARINLVMHRAKDLASSFLKEIRGGFVRIKGMGQKRPTSADYLSMSATAILLLPRYSGYVLIACYHLFGLAALVGITKTYVRSILKPEGMDKSIGSLSGSPFVVVTVEDGGSGVNLRPALEIADAFKRRGSPLLILSTGLNVVRAVERRGHKAVRVERTTIDFLRSRRDYLRLCKDVGAARTAHSESELAGLWNWLTSTGLGLLASTRGVSRVLDYVNRNVRIQALLTVYEALPLSIAAGAWSRQRGLPWIGFFPILVGDRPDGHHFPAPEHLVYGEQLRDAILADGHTAESTVVVGTPTYDAFLNRDPVSDRNYCAKTFPGSRGKKLVVVATEAFADPLVELGPILDALMGMEGVYVVVKVHPSDSPAFFEEYVGTLSRRDDICVAAACDLGAILHTADLLVCIISNIIISAAVLGTPTLVCDFSNKRRVLDFVSEGLCRGCFDPRDVGPSIRRLLFDATEQKRTREMLAYGVKRFNGPNDGCSVERIVSHTLSRATAGAS